MVVLNRIYTRTGDAGATRLVTGESVSKASPRVSAYGEVDELNAVIGLVRQHTTDDAQLDPILARIQNDLFDLGADLATPDRGPAAAGALRIVASQVTRLEEEIDTLNADLAPLTSFVLPGGSAGVRHAASGPHRMPSSRAVRGGVFPGRGRRGPRRRVTLSQPIVGLVVRGRPVRQRRRRGGCALGAGRDPVSVRRRIGGARGRTVRQTTSGDPPDRHRRQALVILRVPPGAVLAATLFGPDVVHFVSDRRQAGEQERPEREQLCGCDPTGHAAPLTESERPVPGVVSG